MEDSTRKNGIRRLTSPDSGAGDGVGVESLVEVEEDTGVLSGVDTDQRLAGGSGAAAASDLEVDALGVSLGTVGLSTGVESEDLVAEDVVAGGEAGGDLNSPGEAVGNQP